MHDPRLDKLADILVRYSTRIKKGDLVEIRSDPSGMPLVAAVFDRVLQAGGHPFWTARSEQLTDAMLMDGSDEQLAYVSPIEHHCNETVDAYIGVWADVNTKSLGAVDPARLAKSRAARKDLMARFLARAAEGSLRWVGTQFPTHASAQDAEMSLSQYADFVFRAGLLHLPNPVAAWEEVFERQERVREYLQGKKEVHFQAPARDGHDGTDLRVNVDGGIWVNCAGQENFPDGEVFAGPQGADGHVNYSFPAVYNGREVEGVRLVFKGGRVVDASASKGEDFLIAMLDQDEGARTMGEIAIGTNYGITEFSKNTLFDEKIGGTFHAACGAGYPESGSTNESGLHWDMVCDLRQGGSIEADGERFHENGLFLRDGWPAPTTNQ